MMPRMLDDLRGSGRTVAIVQNGSSARILVREHDGFDGEFDNEYVLADVSLALLRLAVEPVETGAIPVQGSRPGRRRPRWSRKEAR